MTPSTLEVAQARWNTQLDELSQGWADLPVDWQMVRSEVLEVCRYVVDALTSRSRIVICEA